MNTSPALRWTAPMAKVPATPTPIAQTSTRADADEMRIRVIAQSRATRNGKAAPLPATVEEAQAILAALDAEAKETARV